MGLSIRGYAAHRGVSHTSVRKAIASGRVTLEPDGSIDLAKADGSWVQNADPSKTRASPKLKPVPEAAVSAVRETLSESGSPLVGGMSYLHAKTAEKVLTVQLLREKLRREKGEVVTGLLYVEDDPVDLHQAQNTVATPLNALSDAELVPGSAGLAAFNAALA